MESIVLMYALYNVKQGKFTTFHAKRRPPDANNAKSIIILFFVKFQLFSVHTCIYTHTHSKLFSLALTQTIFI